MCVCVCVCVCTSLGEMCVHIRGGETFMLCHDTVSRISIHLTIVFLSNLRCAYVGVCVYECVSMHDIVHVHVCSCAYACTCVCTDHFSYRCIIVAICDDGLGTKSVCYNNS